MFLGPSYSSFKPDQPKHVTTFPTMYISTSVFEYFSSNRFFF